MLWKPTDCVVVLNLLRAVVCPLKEKKGGVFDRIISVVVISLDTHGNERQS